MADLAEFLLARIGEDEALARDAQAEAPTPWFDNGGTLENAETTLAGYAGEAASPHIARWDPARVLAECEAKRRIVEHAEPDLLAASPGDPYVLQVLALPYAHHPEFQAEWSDGQATVKLSDRV